MRTSTSCRASRILLAAAFAALALGCASTPAAPPSPSGVEATVMIHSGLPNPRFQLDGGAVARLAELLAATTANPSFEGSTVTPSILGYQGILVQNGAGAAELPDALAVHGEDVEIHEGASVRFMRDPGKELESFLLDQAVEQKAISPETLRRIR